MPSPVLQRASPMRKTTLLLAVLLIYYAKQGLGPPADAVNIQLLETGKQKSNLSGAIAPFTCPADSKPAHIFQTKTSYPFWISLHPRNQDPVRWKISHEGRYYETVQEDIFTQILEKIPNSRVIDVGANIGYFSLLSASVGVHSIDSFEPNPKNVARLCESIQRNQWDGTVDHRSRVTIYPMGISNKAGEFAFHQFPRNPGQSSFSTDRKYGGHISSIMLPVITLDEFARDRGYLLSTSTPISILKIDVEGLEAQALLGAKELIHSGNVHNIIMEVEPTQYSDMLQEAFNSLKDAGYALLQVGGTLGPDTPNAWPLDDNLVANMKKSPHKKINLWWQLKSSKG